ncbi:hypothetical protein PUN28_005470 [Cardiocondyla obscurior]|uniref:Uncharacterized protein n=1 Tax=Cardiocondyla obscurior TaxID=286306 RepID=A0AAW2GIZ7_9HYME
MYRRVLNNAVRLITWRTRVQEIVITQPIVYFHRGQLATVVI